MHPTLEKLNRKWFGKLGGQAKSKFGTGLKRHKSLKRHRSTGISFDNVVSNNDRESVKNKQSSGPPIRKRFVSQPAVVMSVEKLESLTSLEHLSPSYSDQISAACPYIVNEVVNLDRPRSFACRRVPDRQSSTLTDRDDQCQDCNRRTTLFDTSESQTALLSPQRQALQHDQTFRSSSPCWLPLFEDDPSYPTAKKPFRVPRHSSSTIEVSISVTNDPNVQEPDHYCHNTDTEVQPSEVLVVKEVARLARVVSDTPRVKARSCSIASTVTVSSLVPDPASSSSSSTPSDFRPAVAALIVATTSATRSMPILAQMQNQRRNSWISVAEIIDTGVQRYAYGLWQTVEEPPAMTVSLHDSDRKVVWRRGPETHSSSSLD